MSNIPNHISHKLEVVEKNDDDYDRIKAVVEQIKELMKSKDSDFDFNKLIPMPPHSDTFFAEGGLSLEDEKKYGENTWYRWSIKNWNTKWNAYSVVWDWDTLYFQTAWSTPEPILRELSKRFPDAEIKVEYADEDWGRNCGIVIYKNGEKISERTDETDRTYPWVMFAEKLYYELSYREESQENKELRDKVEKSGKKSKKKS